MPGEEIHLYYDPTTLILVIEATFVSIKASGKMTSLRFGMSTKQLEKVGTGQSDSIWPKKGKIIGLDPC